MSILHKDCFKNSAKCTKMTEILCGISHLAILIPVWYLIVTRGDTDVLTSIGVLKRKNPKVTGAELPKNFR